MRFNKWIKPTLFMLLSCHAAMAWAAAPTFRDVQFGAQSTGCSPAEAHSTPSPDKRAISILFDKLQAEAGTINTNHDRMRCDVTFILSAPLAAPAKVQVDVRGAINKTGNGKVSPSIKINGQSQPLQFDAKDPESFQRFVVPLRKGAKQFSVSIAASADGEYPESSMLFAIDSLDSSFAQ